MMRPDICTGRTWYFVLCARHAFIRLATDGILTRITISVGMDVFKLVVLNRAIYRGLYQKRGQMVVYSFANCQVYPVVQVNGSLYILRPTFRTRRIKRGFLPIVSRIDCYFRSRNLPVMISLRYSSMHESLIVQLSNRMLHVMLKFSDT